MGMSCMQQGFGGMMTRVGRLLARAACGRGWWPCSNACVSVMLASTL
jgi:hypothetical protein